MTYSSRVVLDVGPLAEAVEGALLPELAEPLLRGVARASRADGRVVVDVEAEDVVALRAGVNTVLRAAAVAWDAAVAAGPRHG